MRRGAWKNPTTQTPPTHGVGCGTHLHTVSSWSAFLSCSVDAHTNHAHASEQRGWHATAPKAAVSTSRNPPHIPRYSKRKTAQQCTGVSVSAVQPSPAHRGGHTAPAPPHPHPSLPFVRHGGQTGTQSPRQQPLRHCSVPLHCTAPFLHTPGSESAAGPSYRSSRRAMAGAGGGSIKTFSTDLRETTPNTFQ